MHRDLPPILVSRAAVAEGIWLNATLSSKFLFHLVDYWLQLFSAGFVAMNQNPVQLSSHQPQQLSGRGTSTGNNANVLGPAISIPVFFFLLAIAGIGYFAYKKSRFDVAYGNKVMQDSV